MGTLSLQFEGVENLHLLGVLGIVIALSVVGYGVWKIVLRGRHLAGAVTAALGLGALACVVAASLMLRIDTPAGKVAWFLLLGGVIVLAVGVFYSAVYAYLGTRRMAFLLAMRFLAIMALLLILFKPALSIQSGRDDSHLVLPVLVDRSASMDTLDHADLPNRYRRACDALAGQGERLSRHFRPTYYHFAEQVQTVEKVEELAELKPTGLGTDGTDLAAAVRRAVSGYSASELAGVILVSDGLHNAAGDVLDAARESPVPIYALGIGSENEAAAGRLNVRLTSVSAPLETIRNNIARIEATVRLTGCKNIPSKVVLSDGDRQIDAQQILADTNAAELHVMLKWTPGDPPQGAAGPDIRKLKIAAELNPAEAVKADNAAELHVMVVNPTVRVLYVEGTLRPEYKYLRRVLAADPNLKFMSLVRIQGNRFLAQGAIDGRQLADLPRTEEEYGFFDVLIIGDLDRTFLSNDQMAKIRKFVHDGKALLMIGGRNSFGPGGYGGTPVEAALPVLLGGRRQQQETTPFVPALTAVGATSPVFAGLEEFFGAPGNKPTKPLPDLLGCVTVPAHRPGANVLAIHPTRRNPAGPLVVLALHQYGKGRAAAFTADTTWKWYLRLHGMGVDSPYHRFWGQLIRYLAGVEKKKKQKVPSVLARLATGYVRQGESFKITALVRNTQGQPADDATVWAEMAVDGSDQPVKIALQRTAIGTGVYEGSHRPVRSGASRVTVKASDEDGADLGSDTIGLTVAAHSRETDRLARDADTLKAVAAVRRGRYAELAALPEIVDEIIDRKQKQLLPAPAARQVNLYNFTLLFLIFIVLVTVEWFVRRTWQLQ